MFNRGKIKQLREKRNWSLADVVYALSKKGHGRTRQTISNWELGKTEPKASDIANLAKAFGVSILAFFRGDI